MSIPSGTWQLVAVAVAVAVNDHVNDNDSQAIDLIEDSASLTGIAARRSR